MAFTCSSSKAVTLILIAVFICILASFLIKRHKSTIRTENFSVQPTPVTYRQKENYQKVEYNKPQSSLEKSLSAKEEFSTCNSSCGK